MKFSNRTCEFVSGGDQSEASEPSIDRPTGRLVQSARRIMQSARLEESEVSPRWQKFLTSSRDPHAFFPAQRLHCPWATHVSPTARTKFMDLSLWIPITAALGLATMGLLFLFIAACEKV
jgi:hypothetical protein